METSKKNSPTGERFLVKRYPKNNEPRTFGVRQGWLDEVAAHIRTKSIGRDDLLFATRVGTPISRNSFRTQVWLPAAASTSGSASTTCVMLTPPGCWQEARICGR